MKKVLKIIGILVGVLLLGVAGVAIYVTQSAPPDYSSVEIKNIIVEGTPEQIVRGKKLVLTNCQSCHLGEDGRLSGQKFDDVKANKDFGTIYTANITKDTSTGMGTYTAGEFYRLMRTGVKKDGQLLSTVMPEWPLVSDEDIYSMYAFLNSDEPMVKASKVEHPVHKSSFLEKALTKFVFKPLPYQDAYPKRPSDNVASVALGKYIVEGESLCYACHSGDIAKINLEQPELSFNYLGGGTVFETSHGESVSLSLLMNEGSEVSKWSEEEFLNAVKYGKRPSGVPYQSPMHPYPMLDSVEVNSIYAYLKDFSKTKE